MKTAIVLLIGLLMAGTSVQASNEKTEESKKAKELVEMNAASAATTNVSGMVVDMETGEGLAGVAIKLEGSSETIYTDFEGNFEISGIAPGQYNINSSYISYQDSKMKNVKVDGVNNALRLVLKKN